MLTLPLHICCFSAPEDKRFLKKMEAHLSALQCDGLISLWHDGLLSPGKDFAQAIKQQVEQAQIILLLLSDAALAYTHCSDVDSQRIVTHIQQRQQAQETLLIPVLLKPVDWRCTPFTTIHPLPTNQKPITQWRNQDEAFATVALDLRRIVDELSKPRSTQDD